MVIIDPEMLKPDGAGIRNLGWTLGPEGAPHIEDSLTPGCGSSICSSSRGGIARAPGRRFDRIDGRGASHRDLLSSL
jgi:hypothetical protein